MYVKENYTISSDMSFSNTVCESVCLYINELNIGIITVYRPPNCDANKFNECINNVEVWMEDRKKQRENTKFIVNGDFNLGFLEAWDPLVISEFLTKNKYRLEKELEISKAKKQAMALLEFTERMNLEQMVKDSTRNDNILDLILTDCMEVIEDIVNIKHDKITDHDTLIVELNVQNKNENNEPKKKLLLYRDSTV